ncbi:MAG: peptidylprolyl isomerase [Waterburya sp.]
MNEEQLISEQFPKIETVSTTEIIQYLKLSRQIPEVLTSLINQKIIAQTAIDKEINIDEKELQIAADRFRYENNLITSKDTLQWLEKYHLSVPEFEALIKSEYLEQKLAEHLLKDQVEAYFYAHQLDYNQAIIYEITLTDFNLAMELFYGLQEQELSFCELAHQYIKDDDLRRLGGYQGMKNRMQLHPEIAAAVFALSQQDLPQVLKPITIDKQVHLIYVEEIIQPELTTSLAKEIRNQLFNNWLTQQRQQLIKGLEIVD